MAQTILTPTMVTREALRVLHQKLNFVGNVTRSYDDRFAQSGAKIGDSLQIRLPNEYSVRVGKTLAPQETVETSTTLTVANQVGVDVNFSSAEMTMQIDDFSKRILEPAMARLAAYIEADALSMYKDVPSQVSDVGAAVTYEDVLDSQRKLTDNLAPMDARTLLLTSQMNVDLVKGTASLFNDRTKVGDQYRKGLIGNDFFGYDNVFQNTLLPLHTSGTDTGAGVYLTDIAAGEATGTAGLLHIDTGATTFTKGDVIMIEGVFSVHPESKQSTGRLKEFVVTTAYAGGEGDLAIYPSIVTSGAKQNVVAAAADGKKILKVESDETTAITAGLDYYVGLGFHKEAFAFATADLVMPGGVDFSARQVMDGISMRIVRQYDINNDNLPCRIDVLYGYKTIRPELAVRLGFN